MNQDPHLRLCKHFTLYLPHENYECPSSVDRPLETRKPLRSLRTVNYLLKNQEDDQGNDRAAPLLHPDLAVSTR